jgi:AcrR family transcriptional regulator
MGHTGGVAAKRTYLRADDRRHQLLDAAVALATRDGIEAVSMVALAHEAGVSRQLVYDHFTDLPTLLEAILDDLVTTFASTIDDATFDSDDPAATILGMFHRAIRLPPEQQRIARMLVAGVGSLDLDRARTRLRDHFVETWTRPSPSSEPADAPTAVAIWSAAAAVLTIADAVGRGEISEDDGAEVVTFMTHPLVAAPRRATRAGTSTRAGTTTRTRTRPRT